MIRLPSTHVAITAPLVAASTRYPGIPIGQSLLDGRPFTLSPVLVYEAELPSTNSLGLGGLGSGKSTTGKMRARREILHHSHQYVVIDSFGENSSGEWAALTHSLEGLVIDARTFTLNPVSELLPREVREQLVRSLILAVEPDALTPQATHALQHALTSPKATALGGLVDALTKPEDGRWPAARLAEWGEGAAIALSRYTDGSLQGLFDGEGAELPPVDVPIISFDFSRLDRSSPAIPSLMAAVTCWVEHVWLPQSTAVHRHLVLEEAWQILLSPATSRLIQRLVKNSRKAALSLDVLMHTLSDLGEGAARDLARLCEVVHVGRLGPEEAAIVGSLLGLPAWAITRIPRLGPGEAIWKVGPDHVDVVRTILTEEEARLTDTSSRRRQAQEAYAAAQEQLTDPALEADSAAPAVVEEEDPRHDLLDDETEDATLGDLLAVDEDWGWDMPPNVIDVRHETALRAAQEGRCSEAADIAALGERDDIATHGINSPEAVAWLSTRALVADLCGTPGQAQRLRATVARMGHTTALAEQTTPHHVAVSPRSEEHTGDDGNPQRRRRVITTVAVAALGLTAGLAWMTSGEDAKAAAQFKGKAGTPVTIDGVTAHVDATWTGSDSVIIALTTDTDTPEGEAAQLLRIDVGDETASTRATGTEVARSPEVTLPVSDPAAPVTVRVAIGGKTWTAGSRASARQIRLDPATGTATDITKPNNA
ncbi:hypothetical protein [Streptomyces nitrosporeus]|uniref:hypothetical protein n=1 Tax=Streptomyces nitrosporeus TaxID=28894 RepID=UPI00167EC882|nr:hypothetical protein [Streptomyces nitrosporeus]GGZ29472.1 hypothetical protein GCM10010327_69700 [Streptomyces nitrosporeus]